MAMFLRRRRAPSTAFTRLAASFLPTSIVSQNSRIRPMNTHATMKVSPRPNRSWKKVLISLIPEKANGSSASIYQSFFLCWPSAGNLHREGKPYDSPSSDGSNNLDTPADWFNTRIKRNRYGQAVRQVRCKRLPGYGHKQLITETVIKGRQVGVSGCGGQNSRSPG